MNCLLCNASIENKKESRRGYCKRCYSKALYNGTIFRIHKPDLPKNLSNDQESILVGSMLGDGNLSMSTGDANLNIGRAQKDLEYLRWEFEFFKDFCLSGIRSKTFFDTRYNKTYYNVSFHTRQSPLFTNFYNQWYPAPNRKKIIPPNIKLTPLALAVWLCDDGSVVCPYKPYRLNLQLCTNCFTEEDVRFLISLLEKRYNEQFLLEIDSKNHPIIKAGDNATRAFLNEIDGYMPDSMIRKSEKWRAPIHNFYVNKPPRTFYHNKRLPAKLTGIELEILSLLELNKLTHKQILPFLKIKKSSLHLYLQKFETKGFVLVEKRSPLKGGYIYSTSKLGIDIINFSRNEKINYE